jgi:splicing factor 3A subunit 1
MFFIVELLDPRWKEQRARADAKFATTNLSTTDVAANLKRLASQRADLFDVQSGTAMTDEERERNRKKAVTSWDGHAESRETVRMQQLQNSSMAEQVSAIHKKQQEFLNPSVGPRRN